MSLLLELAGGLGLFLFGMNFMSQGLQKAAGAKLRSILTAISKNKYVAVLFGALFTAIIQSSGATTVMVVTFVNAGLMELTQAVGISVVPMKEAKKQLPDRVIMGNISTYALEFSTPEKVAALTELCAEASADIVAPACGLDTKSPMDNITSILKTLKRRAL